MMQYIVFLGAVINLTFTSFYIKATIRGETKPNRITWLMWSITPLIATSAALSDGVHRAALPIFVSGFAPLLVLLSSFVNKKAYRKLEKIDYLCGISSALALILWRITKEPAIATLFAIISDLLAAFPTLIKSWKHPKTESANAYIGGLCNASSSFFAIKMFSFTEIGFPVYLVIINIILISVICIRKQRQ